MNNVDTHASVIKALRESDLTPHESAELLANLLCAMCLALGTGLRATNDQVVLNVSLSEDAPEVLQ